jgi:hypothetical protein
MSDKGNNKITELRTILQRESQNSYIWSDKIIQQPENCENRNDPYLVQAFLKKWWVESDYKAHIWKIYDFKIEVVPFIINFSTELTTVVKFEVYVQKWCGRSCICGLFNLRRDLINYKISI